jgi:hypothetical protein
MPTKLEGFQCVLETFQRAQTCGAIAVLNDRTTRETDDQDCYPRGLRLNLDPHDPRWPSIRFLAKHLDWILLEGKKSLHIRSPQPIPFRLTEVSYLTAVAESLREGGVECSPDVYYR